MKNKAKARIAPLFGIIVLAIIGLSMIGCEEETTIVDYDYSQAPQVSAVTVTKTTNKQYFIVTWDAVKGEDINYDVYYKQDGKETAQYLANANNTVKYDPDTGAAIPNDDFDKWSARVSGLGGAAGSYRIGVRTGKDDGKTSVIYSDIKWSDAIAITALPAITPTLTLTTDKAYVIVTFAGNKDANSNAYTLTLYKDNIQVNTYISLQNNYSYAVADGAQTANDTDAKKANWAALVSTNNLAAGTYFVTLTNRYYGETSDVGIVQSVPTKSGTITITAP